MNKDSRELYHKDYLEIVSLFREYMEEKEGMGRGQKSRGKFQRKESTWKEKNSEELLEDIRRSIQNCQECSLYRSRTHLVFGAGNPEAELMLIGEAPGRDEDLQGKPFVGAAGRLLTEGLRRAGLSRE